MAAGSLVLVDLPPVSFQARTTAAADGSFAIEEVPSGDYYVYGRVLWASTAKDTTSFGGDAWLGTVKVVSGDTSQVVLRNRRSFFAPESVPAGK